MNENNVIETLNNSTTIITTWEDFWKQKSSFDNIVNTLSTRDQIIYNQAFEIYKAIFEYAGNYSDDVENYHYVRDMDHVKRGYEFIIKNFFGKNIDTFELYKKFSNEAEKLDSGIENHKERTYLLGMADAFLHMNTYNLEYLTKEDVAWCEVVFVKLIEGKKFKEFPFEKEKAYEVKLNITNLKDLVHTLIELRNSGNNVYVERNGVKLYSCDITMDKALLEMVNSDKSTIDDSTKKVYIDYLKKNALEINFYRQNIDNSVKTLQEYREKGLNVYISCYNDIKLYSCDVTIDSAYVELTGQTKAEFDKSIEETDKKIKAEQEQKKAELIAKIPSYIEEGKKIIYPERLEDWTKEIKSSIEGIYQGAPLIEALDLMKQLDKGESLEKVKETLDNKNVGGNAYEIVIRIVLNFSKRGPEFYEKATDNKLTGEIKQMVDDVKKENAELEEKHKNDSGKHESDNTSDEPVESQSQDNLDEPDDFGDGDDDVE